MANKVKDVRVGRTVVIDGTAWRIGWDSVFAIKEELRRRKRGTERVSRRSVYLTEVSSPNFSKSFPVSRIIEAL